MKRQIREGKWGITQLRNRHLDWDDCYNARDLGGLSTKSGYHIRWQAIVRSDGLNWFGSSSWDALHRYGIRTIVDLRNHEEVQEDSESDLQSYDITRLHLPHDGFEDLEFWNSFEEGIGYAGTPLYYHNHLKRMPERTARVLSAIAHAKPGAVLFHCVAGRDRTGIISLVLLHLLGVHQHEIVADYELSDERLRRRWARIGKPEPSAKIAKYLSERGTTAREIIVEFLNSGDIENKLDSAGFRKKDLEALRQRLLVANE